VSFGFATWLDGRVGFAPVAPGPERPADAPSFVPPDGAAVECGALRPGTRVLAQRRPGLPKAVPVHAAEPGGGLTFLAPWIPHCGVGRKGVQEHACPGV